MVIADAEADLQTSIHRILRECTTLRAATIAVKWLHALEEAYKDRVEARGQRGIDVYQPLVQCDSYALRQRT